VLFLYGGPLETDLAQEKVLPTNEILFPCCSKGDRISGGAEQEGLMGRESGHKTGADVSEDWSKEENLRRAKAKAADICRRSHARWFPGGHSMGRGHYPILFA